MISETVVDMLLTVFLTALLVAMTAVVVIGGATFIWIMVTDLIDAIRKREEKEDK